VSLERQLSPGPGTYDVKLRPDAPIYTIGQKHEGRNGVYGVPGPGHYDPLTTIIHERPMGTLIGPTHWAVGGKKEVPPGPGLYDP
jgi:hypothetical protein